MCHQYEQDQLTVTETDSEMTADEESEESEESRAPAADD